MIGLVLADDHRVFAEGLGVMLDAQDDLAVLGVAHDSHQAIELAARHEPAVLLLDAHMPGPDLATTPFGAVQASPSTRVPMLSADTREVINEALAAGADGFLAKDASAARSPGPSAPWSPGGQHRGRGRAGRPPRARPQRRLRVRTLSGRRRRSSACWPTAGQPPDRRVLPVPQHRPHPRAERPGQAGRPLQAGGGRVRPRAPGGGRRHRRQPEAGSTRSA